MSRIRNWVGRPEVRQALLITVASRLLLGVAAWVTTTWFPGYPGHAVWDGQQPVTTGLSGLLLAPFERDDSVYFLAIAHHGYDAVGLTPFFPLYPLLISALGTLFGGSYLLAALVITTVSYFAALVVLGVLARELLGANRGRFALWVFALWPFAWYFDMPLTEPLFFALSAGCFLALRRQRPAAASALAVLAALTRFQGVLLVLPICVDAWQRRSFGRSLFAIPPVAASGLFYLYLSAVQHFPGGFTAGEAGWHQHVAAPWQIFADSLQAIANGRGEEAANVAMLAIAILSLVWIRKLGPGLLLYVAASLALIVFREAAPTPYLSAARFIAVLFPVQFVVARFLWSRRALRGVTLGVLAFCQVVLFVTDVRFVWVG